MTHRLKRLEYICIFSLVFLLAHLHMLLWALRLLLSRFPPHSHDAALASGVLLGRNAASPRGVTPSPQFLPLFYLKSVGASLEAEKIKQKKKTSFGFFPHCRQIGSVGSDLRSCRAELPGRLPVASQITAIFSASGVFNFLLYIALFIVMPAVIFSPFLSEGVAVFGFISFCYLFPHLCLPHSPFSA